MMILGDFNLGPEEEGKKKKLVYRNFYLR